MTEGEAILAPVRCCCVAKCGPVGRRKVMAGAEVAAILPRVGVWTTISMFSP